MTNSRLEELARRQRNRERPAPYNGKNDYVKIDQQDGREPIKILRSEYSALEATLKVAGKDVKEYLSETEEVVEGGRLVKLNLNECKMKRIPEEIGELTGLRGLYLYGNQLATLPNSIGKLTQLHILFLGGNQFREMPAFISELRQLEILEFMGNPATELPNYIVKLPELRGILVSKGVKVPDKFQGKVMFI